MSISLGYIVSLSKIHRMKDILPQHIKHHAWPMDCQRNHGSAQLSFAFHSTSLSFIWLWETREPIKTNKERSVASIKCPIIIMLLKEEKKCVILRWHTGLELKISSQNVPTNSRCMCQK